MARRPWQRFAAAAVTAALVAAVLGLASPPAQAQVTEGVVDVAVGAAVCVTAADVTAAVVACDTHPGGSLWVLAAMEYGWEGQSLCLAATGWTQSAERHALVPVVVDGERRTYGVAEMTAGLTTVGTVQATMYGDPNVVGRCIADVPTSPITNVISLRVRRAEVVVPLGFAGSADIRVEDRTVGCTYFVSLVAGNDDGSTIGNVQAVLYEIVRPSPSMAASTGLLCAAQGGLLAAVQVTGIAVGPVPDPEELWSMLDSTVRLPENRVRTCRGSEFDVWAAGANPGSVWRWSFRWVEPISTSSDCRQMASDLPSITPTAWDWWATLTPGTGSDGGVRVGVWSRNDVTVTVVEDRADDVEVVTDLTHTIEIEVPEFGWEYARGRLAECWQTSETTTADAAAVDAAAEAPDEAGGILSQAWSFVARLPGNVVGTVTDTVAGLGRWIVWAVQSAACTVWRLAVPNGSQVTALLLGSGEDCAAEGAEAVPACVRVGLLTGWMIVFAEHDGSCDGMDLEMSHMIGMHTIEIGGVDYEMGFDGEIVAEDFLSTCAGSPAHVLKSDQRLRAILGALVFFLSTGLALLIIGGLPRVLRGH